MKKVSSTRDNMIELTIVFVEFLMGDCGGWKWSQLDPVYLSYEGSQISRAAKLGSAQRT